MTGRLLHGVTLHDPTKAYQGFTIFTPISWSSNNNVWLIDMGGRIVHRWHMPHWVAMQGVLLPNGNLLYGGKLRGAPVRDLPAAGGLLMEVDWDGKLVWKYEDLYLNAHDWIRLKNGNTLIVRYVPVPEELAAKVKGGISGSEWHKAELGGKGVMWGDCYREITPAGKVVWEWNDWEHLDPDLDAIEPRAPRSARAMNNSIYELPDGNILTSMVFIDTIATIDRATGNIKWQYGPAKESWWRNPISFQHNPTLLPNGNILLFDNGRHRVDPPWFHPPDYSRIIEINPKTDEIEWEYKDQNPADFYSTFMSGCERLPNGNTLVCEAAHGRIFEVTYNKEMVWEYVSPFYYRHPSPHFGVNNMMYRAHRYGPEYPGLHGRELDPARYETWNRLYAAAPYRQVPRPRWGRIGIEGEPPVVEEERPAPTPAVRQKEQQPSAEEKAFKERLESLGY